jgi:hypothetical protein
MRDLLRYKSYLVVRKESLQQMWRRNPRENKTMSRKSIILENKWVPYVDSELSHSKA